MQSIFVFNITADMAHHLRHSSKPSSIKLVYIKIERYRLHSLMNWIICWLSKERKCWWQRDSFLGRLWLLGRGQELHLQLWSYWVQGSSGIPSVEFGAVGTRKLKSHTDYLPNLQYEGGFHVENWPAVWCYPKVAIHGISIGAQDQAVRRDRQWAIGRMP